MLSLHLSLCSLLTHPNYKIDSLSWQCSEISSVSPSLCLGIQLTAEQFTSALIAIASTAGLNGVHDREIWAQAFHMHLPTASQISCSITMGLGEKGKLDNTSDVQSRSITVNGIFQICVCMYFLVFVRVSVCVCRMWAVSFNLQGVCCV